MSEPVDSKMECDIQGGCGSSDAMVLYDDGHKYCYSCQESDFPIIKGRITANEAQVAKAVVKNGLSFKPLPIRYYKNEPRCIQQDTMRKYGYGEGHDNHKKWCHITPRRNESGEVIGQKIRYPDKSFVTIGLSKDPQDSGTTFWGQHLFSKGKKVVITEGELDAMSMFEAMGSKWPVVSLPDGAGSVKRTFAAQIKWLEQWDEIVLCFDEDTAGEKARQDAVKVIPPGKARVMRMPLKDANEMHRAGRDQELVDAMWNAKQVRPDGILGGDDLWTEFTKENTNTYITLPFQGLQDMWGGWRDGEITLLGAGSGVGKTTLIKEFLGHALDQGDKVGGIFLEENIRRQVQGMMTYYAGFPVHMSMMGNYCDMDDVKREKLKGIWEDKLKGKLELYNHFGVMDPKELISNLRYMAVALGCRTLILDHITMLANAAEDGGERLILDSTMQGLRSMVEETGVRLLVASHLNRPKGKPYEEGAQVNVSSFRGSTQLICLADNAFGAERNQQHPQHKDYTLLRSLKCRITGTTGVACWLHYDKVTGRMVECDEPDGGMAGTGEDTIKNETY